MTKRPNKKKGNGRPSPAPKPSAAGPPKEPVAPPAKPKKPAARPAKPNKPSAKSAKRSAASKTGSKRTTPPRRAEPSRASPKKVGSRPASTVQRVHFEDFDGHQFERLAFAYLLRARNWKTLDWLGQVGSDDGRDIVGETDEDPSVKVLVQAANRERLTFEKVRADLAAAVEKEGDPPDQFIVVCGRGVSAQLRSRIRAHAESLGVAATETWSGPEFEERIRAKAETLLRRFVDGEVFPDAPDQLKRFAQEERGAPPRTIASGPGSTIAGRDIVVNIGRVHLSDEGEPERDDDVIEDHSLGQSEAVALGARSLSSVLYARSTQDSRSPHFWRVGVFGHALQLPSVERQLEDAFRDLVLRTFPENAAADLGDASSSAIVVEQLGPGVSRMWGRWDGVVGMAAAVDEALRGRYRAQEVAALVTRFLCMVPTLVGRGRVTVSLELDPADRTLVAEGSVQNIRRPRCGETFVMSQTEEVELRDLGHIAMQMAVRLLEPLLREFHLVRIDPTRFTQEVAALLNSRPPTPPVPETPPSSPVSSEVSVHAVNRSDALRTLNGLSMIDVAYLRLAAEETLAGRVLVLSGGATNCAGPLLSPGQGLVTTDAVQHHLARQIDGLQRHRVEESERRLSANDLISAEFAPEENFAAAGRPTRPGRVPAFSRVTRQGLRVLVAAAEVARGATTPPDVAYAAVEASFDLDLALDRLLSNYDGIMQRFRGLAHRRDTSSFTGEFYARLHVVDDATARHIDLIRETRDALLSGRPASGLSPALVRTTHAIAQSLTEPHPRLTLITRPADHDRQPPRRPALILAVANYGQTSADGVSAVFHVPGGFGLNHGEHGGWFQNPSMETPRVGPIQAPAYGDVVVAELRRFRGNPVQGSVLKWSLTGGGARPVEGELQFEPNALEPT